MAQLTSKQKKIIVRLVAKSFAKNFLEGVHHGAMLFVLNFIVFMASQVLFEGNQTLTMVMSVLASIFVLNRMHSIVHERHKRLKEDIQKIIKQ